MKLLKKCLSLACLSLAALTAQAEADYPSRPVTIVVPFPAGGGADYLARSLAEQLNKKLNQTFLVDNRGGASGIIAAQHVKRAKADGYTLLFTPEPIVALNQLVFQDLPYSIQDFAPIGSVFSSRIGVMVSSKNPNIQTLDGLIKYARENPDSLNYASFGVASSPHLHMELFKKLTGTKITHVSYRGAAPAIQDLAAGNVDVTVSGGGSGGGLLTSGRVRMLAITGTGRNPAMPDVPTFKEIKGLEAMDNVTPYTGVLAPAGTPAPVIQKISLALKEILADKNFIEQKIKPVSTEAHWTSPEDYAQLIARLSAFWAPLVKEAGIKSEEAKR